MLEPSTTPDGMRWDAMVWVVTMPVLILRRHNYKKQQMQFIRTLACQQAHNLKEFPLCNANEQKTRLKDQVDSKQAVDDVLGSLTISSLRSQEDANCFLVARGLETTVFGTCIEGNRRVATPVVFT